MSDPKPQPSTEAVEAAREWIRTCLADAFEEWTTTRHEDRPKMSTAMVNKIREGLALLLDSRERALREEIKNKEALIKDHLAKILHLENRVGAEAFRAEQAEAKVAEMEERRAESAAMNTHLLAKLVEARGLLEQVSMWMAKQHSAFIHDYEKQERRCPDCQLRDQARAFLAQKESER